MLSIIGLLDSLHVVYIAEYLQNLHAVQVFLRINTDAPSHEIDFEVLPKGEDDDGLMGSNTFIIRVKSNESDRFTLPVPVVIGLQTLKPSGDHYEIKLTVPPLAQLPAEIPDATRLLDGAQLSSSLITSPTLLVRAASRSQAL